MYRLLRSEPRPEGAEGTGAVASREVPKALPKRTLEKIHLGQSFAEYDTLLTRNDVFVRTPALNAAADISNPHCFFVGRRGTGKTTITRFLDATMSDILLIRPQIFSPSTSRLDLGAFKDANQRPFRSLISAFRRTLQDEVLLAGSASSARFSRCDELVEEFALYGEFDFDLRALGFIEELIGFLSAGDDRSWISAIKKPKQLGMRMSEALKDVRGPYSILIDAIDESWDGSELAVIYLAAMMHACLEINSQNEGLRVLMFLRENIFERVRIMDTEFARLETCVVGLDWSEEQLLETVERRLNSRLTSKFQLGGQTWDLFFEGRENSRKAVFDYCQNRPRDVLTYCALALESAQAHKREQIALEDLYDARRRFSDSRLKDLGDEYQENYPQVGIVLSRFYGLGRRWTLSGIGEFLRRLLDDNEVITVCSSWIYKYSSPEQFVRLLYDIGFFGLAIPRRDGEPRVSYRSLGPRSTTPPPIDSKIDIAVHPSYWDGLDLLDVLVTEFGESNDFGRLGVVNDFPGALNLEQYQNSLDQLNIALKEVATGREQAAAFESLVGQVLELCFFRVLYNVEPQSRDVSGTVRRDWIASNRAETGFWEMVRHRHGASQVIFECKNYEDLDADDFHQMKYYMNEHAGKFIILVFRGEVKNHYFDHISKLSAGGGMILLLNDKDLRVFVRQARNGRVKDSHLQDRYDRAVRMIS
jgi:hypothetical protein